MATELVAQGTPGSLGALGQFEDRFKEGDRGELRLTLRLIPPGTVGSIQGAINLAQIPAGPVRTEPGRVLVIPFTKGLPILVILAGILIGAILLLVILWELRRVLEVFADIPGAGLIVVGIIVLVVLAGVGRRKT